MDDEQIADGREGPSESGGDADRLAVAVVRV